MKKTLIRIALGLVAVLVLIVVYAAMQPAEYDISRSITINAPVEKVFPYLNNSKLADQWGPWKEDDPQAKMVFSGPDEGVGSKSSWESPGKLGTGSATIIESKPNELVRLELVYTKPHAMHQIADYIVEPNGGETKVTWRVAGNNSLPGRIACLFFDMDKMVGGFFEKGLANLKALVERP